MKTKIRIIDRWDEGNQSVWGVGVDHGVAMWHKNKLVPPFPQESLKYLDFEPWKTVPEETDITPFPLDSWSSLAIAADYFEEHDQPEIAEAYRQFSILKEPE